MLVRNELFVFFLSFFAPLNAFSMAVGAPGYTVTLSKGDSPVAIGRPKNRSSCPLPHARRCCVFPPVFPPRATLTDVPAARRSRLVVVLSAVLLLAAVVATASSFGGPDRNSLDEAEDYLRVPRRLANLAADHDDRDGLADALRAGRAAAERDAATARKKQQLHASRRSYMRRGEHHSARKFSKEEVAEQHAKDINARDERAMMSSATMVPWVRWPKGDDFGGSTEYASARKQQLLQMPMLMGSDVKDNAAAVLPLSEIMDRLKVDSKLHQVGALAAQACRVRMARSSPHPNACGARAPFWCC